MAGGDGAEEGMLGEADRWASSAAVVVGAPFVQAGGIMGGVRA